MKCVVSHHFFTAIFFIALIFAGCGDDPCPEGCAEGESCVSGQCVTTSAQCEEPCADNESCVNGFCIERPVACDQVGVTCDPTQAPSDGFLCIDLDGPGPGAAQCLSNCGAGGACDVGALCFFVSSPIDTPCASDAECDDSLVCQQGACRETVCRPSECEGYLDGIETCEDLYGGTGAFGYDALCAEVGNGAAFCFSSGPRAEGEACVDLIDAIDTGDFSAACQPGLGCVDGTCQAACETDDDCAGGDTCLLASDNFFGEGVGFCASSCTPFSDESGCAEGRTCRPIAAGEGLCVQSGDTQPFEECTPGTNECVSGTTCVQLQGQNAATGAAAIARCMPLCDVSAGPSNPDGSVGNAAQAQRDATCPNPPPAPAGLQFIHLAESVGAVDIYLADEMQPTFANVAFGARTDADEGTDGAQFLETETGALAFRALPAGAPRTDPELIGGTIALDAGLGETRALISEPGTADSAFALPADPLALDPGQEVALRVVHASFDASEIDLVAVPTGDDLSDPTSQVELATGLDTGGSSSSTLAPGTWDLLVFEAGNARAARADALVEVNGLGFAAGDALEVFVAGTVDATDLAPLAIITLPAQVPFERPAAGPTYTCVDLANDVFGYCQQRCPSPDDYASGLCEGQAMGCVPQFVAGPERFESLCSPVGVGASGAACNPFARYGECEEGLYCLEYGNTVDDFDDANRGRCTELCVQGEAANPTLSCSSMMTCGPLSPDDEFLIGECGFACMPDTSYSDAACPAGLGSCLPSASLLDDPGNPDAPPIVVEEAPFCAAAGDVPVGGNCSAADCVSGAECLFERSVQGTFINSLLSAYVGAAGQPATCTPRCDPFDGDGSTVECVDGQTCLFNFPFSAEVGHCANIAETVAPGQPCTQPGLACGEDSICVVNGDQNVCFQFCQYAGDDGMGGFSRGSCTSGFECRPLVADIGVCQEPG